MHSGFEFNYLVLILLIEAMIFAVCTSSVQTVLVWFSTRNSSEARVYLAFAALFPLLCVVWLACIFELQAIVNKKYLARDALISEIHQTPLVNRYGLFMCDRFDFASVSTGRREWPSDTKLKEQSDLKSGWQPIDYGVEFVSEMQVVDNFLICAIDRNFAKQVYDRDCSVPFFIVDTKSNLKKGFYRLEELEDEARKLGLKETISLSPVIEVYRKYRFTAFDYVCFLLFILPPLAILAIFWLNLINRLKASTQKEKG